MQKDTGLGLQAFVVTGLHHFNLSFKDFFFFDGTSETFSFLNKLKAFIATGLEDVVEDDEELLEDFLFDPQLSRKCCNTFTL